MESQQIIKHESKDSITVRANLMVDFVELDSGVYAAHCSAIGVSTQGNSRVHALKMIKEAIQTFIEAAHEMHTLDEIINECNGNLSRNNQRARAAELAARKQINEDFIEVPVSLVVAKGLGLVEQTAHR